MTEHESTAGISIGPSVTSVVLCVDDDATVRGLVTDILTRAGFRTFAADSVDAALVVAKRDTLDCIVTDEQMPGKLGRELPPLLREAGVDVPVIILTGQGTIDDAVKATQLGVHSYLTKPVIPARLIDEVTDAIQKQWARRELTKLRAGDSDAVRRRRRIIGESPQAKKLMRDTATAARGRSTVLIEGESGTGKELIAAALHDLGDPVGAPYIAVNCAAVPDGLFESVLFGHERGSFTGALKQSLGAFERADGGTLLLDEISEMRLDLQAKLLRVLQERKFERVGGSKPISVDVRVVASTNRTLAHAVRDGTFRADLFYRLNVVRLRIPPLRERPTDIPVLANHFLRRAASELSRPATSIADEAMDALIMHRWPGNVRELEHTIERAVVFCEGAVVEPRHLPELGASIIAEPPSADPATDAETPTGDMLPLTSLNVEAAERHLIRLALERSGGNRTLAADMLGMHVRTLRRKLTDDPELRDLDSRDE